MSKTLYGKKTWLIPDGFWHSKSNGLFPSHEAICVLNTSNKNANLNITLFFEDREEINDFFYNCEARRTSHIRMDKLVSKKGNVVPIDVPYAILVESDAEIVVQYSRMDTSQNEMALMTTIAYPID